MPFGVPACAQTTEYYDGCSRSELLYALEDALAVLDWRADSMGPFAFTARVGISWWSWGERLTIEVFDGRVRIFSECVWPQNIDWGKNQRNIEQLLFLLGKIINSRRRAGLAFSSHESRRT